MDKIKNEILKNTLVTFNEGGQTKSLKTKDDGTLELLGCIDQNTKFKIEGYCESAKLATISGPIVEMTQFTCKYNISDYFLLNFEFSRPN